jgi:hypothetical protein
MWLLDNLTFAACIGDRLCFSAANHVSEAASNVAEARRIWRHSSG